MPMSKQISAINVLSDVCPRGGPFQTQILIRLVISIRIPFTLLRSITGIINTAPAFGNRKDHINLASLLLAGWASTGAGKEQDEHGVSSTGPERGLRGNGASAWKEPILGKRTWHVCGAAWGQSCRSSTRVLGSVTLCCGASSFNGVHTG